MYLQLSLFSLGFVQERVFLHLVICIYIYQRQEACYGRSCRIRNQRGDEPDSLRYRRKIVGVAATSDYRTKPRADYTGRAADVSALYWTELSGARSGISVATRCVRRSSSVWRLCCRRSGYGSNGRPCKSGVARSLGRLAVQRLGSG